MCSHIRQKWRTNQVASDLLKVRDSIRLVRTERRNAIADYFNAISATLQEIRDSLANNRPPDFALGKLREYAQQLPEVCKDFLPVDETSRLSDELASYWPPGDLLKLMEDDLLPAHFPTAYAEAAGKFKALADSVKARP